MEEPIGFRILMGILCIFILVSLVAFSKWREYTKAKRLKYLVAWSVTTNYLGLCSIRPGLDLIDYVHEVAHTHKLPKKYSITGDAEISIAKDILKEFQRVLTQEYFNDRLSLPKIKYGYNDDNTRFFFAYLFNFLQKHECDYDFIGNAMHTQRLNHKQYGQSFSSGSESTYQLSEFGIVFHKLYYISYLFCRNDRIYGEQMPSGITRKSITDILDSNEITICRQPY